MSKIAQILEEILKIVCENKDKVKVNEVIGSSISVLEIEADNEDVKFIIGKEGKMIRALETVFTAMGRSEKRKIVLTIKKT